MCDSAPDGSKRSVNERIDIRVGVERRRRWGCEDKLRIVRESLAPNVVVTEVARWQFEQPMVGVRAASHRRARGAEQRPCRRISCTRRGSDRLWRFTEGALRAPVVVEGTCES